MEITGKCREEFKKWQHDCNWFEDFNIYNENYRNIEIFYTLTPSMQYGVYVDFFDSVGINITDYVRFYEISWSGFVSDICEGKYHNKGRQYSRLKAIEKANEIYNDAH